MTTEHTPELQAHGCAIYTIDDWRDGTNYGGKFICSTVSADTRNPLDYEPTEERLEMAGKIVRALNSFDAMKAALSAALLETNLDLGLIDIKRMPASESKRLLVLRDKLQAALALAERGEK